jgi:hypothetical protein
MLLTSSHLILEYDGDVEGFYDGELLAVQEEAERQPMAADLGGPKNASDDELDHYRAGKRQRGVAAFRPTSIRFSLTAVSHPYLWRYRHCEFLPYDAGGRIWQVVHSAAANI